MNVALLTQKNAPLAVLVAGSLLLGGLINQHPPGVRDSVAAGLDFECPSEPLALAQRKDNGSLLSSSSGLLPEPLVAFLALVFPLLPILAPSFVSTGRGGSRKLLAHLEQGDTWKLVVCHALGQSGSFSTSELARFFIVKPNAQFFTDCNLSGEECRKLAAEGGRMQKRQIVWEDKVEDDGDSTVLCQNTTSTYPELRENLHGFPDVASALVGASVASFFLSASARRRNKKRSRLSAEEAKEKTGDAENTTPKDDEDERDHRQDTPDRLALAEPYFKYIFALLSLGAIVLLLLDRYCQSKNTPSEMLFALLAGASFQLAVNFIFAGKIPVLP